MILKLHRLGDDNIQDRLIEVKSQPSRMRMPWNNRMLTLSIQRDISPYCSRVMPMPDWGNLSFRQRRSESPPLSRAGHQENSPQVAPPVAVRFQPPYEGFVC